MLSTAVRDDYQPTRLFESLQLSRGILAIAWFPLLRAILPVERLPDLCTADSLKS